MAVDYKQRKQQSTETVHLGTFMHPCETLLVLKLECKDVPYPNSPVLFKGKQVGKIDEVLGTMDNAFASVKLEGQSKVSDFNSNSKFEAYKDKFIFKSRLLPREEVEKKKEMKDQMKSSGDKYSRGGNFNREGGKKNFSREGTNNKRDNFRKDNFKRENNRNDNFKRENNRNDSNKRDNFRKDNNRNDNKRDNRNDNNRSSGKFDNSRKEPNYRNRGDSKKQ